MIKEILKNIKQSFTKTETELRKEGEHAAFKRFNIRYDDDVPYITFDGVIVTTNSDGDLLSRLAKLRSSFVEDYIKKDGRI